MVDGSIDPLKIMPKGDRKANNDFIKISDFKKKFESQPYKGLFWADDALLQYLEYLKYIKDEKTPIFSPCIINDDGLGFKKAHDELSFWYNSQFFKLLEERINSESIINPTLTNSGYYESVKQNFSKFHRKFIKKKSLLNKSCLKKIIIKNSNRLVYPDIVKKDGDFSDIIDSEGRLKPNIIDKVGRFIDSESGLFLLEIFFLIRNESVLKNFLNILEFYPEKDLIELNQTPVITILPWDHQKKALNGWIHNKNRGVVEMATATGKTLVGIMAIEWMYSHYPKHKYTLIVCHSTIILNQWRREIIKKLGLDVNSNQDYKHEIQTDSLVIRFETIQTVIKNPQKYRTNLLIVDEVHHYASGSGFGRISEVPYNFKIGLTAELGNDFPKGEILKNIGPIVYKYPLLQALKDQVVPEFEWIVHPVYLDILENEKFNKISNEIISTFEAVRNDTDTIRDITGHNDSKLNGINDFIRLVEIARYNARYNKTDLPGNWKKLQIQILLRRQIIHKSRPKLERAIQLTKSLANNHKIIVFLMNIESCDVFYQAIKNDIENVFVIHYQIKENPYDVVKRFEHATTGVLIGAQMLNEGIDIPSADIGINVSYTKTQLQLIQRMGRIIRKEKGKKPKFFQFVALPERTQLIEEIDVQQFADDLAWVQATALKMNLDISVKWDFGDIMAYQDIVEKYIQNNSFYYDGVSKIGTLNIKNILSDFDPDAIHRMPSILQLFKNEPISDRQWVDIVKTAYSEEKNKKFTKGEYIQIDKFWYLLIIGERKADYIEKIFKEVGVGKSPDYKPLPNMRLGEDGQIQFIN